VGGKHLELFLEQNAQGVQVSVFNIRTEKWIAPSEAENEIEEGEEKAALYAKAYLKHAANVDLPRLR
jgi:hypothetical protein